MLKKISLIVLIFTVLSMASYSAPLFPDVPADQWARDAVAQLAAKGLIEGYPDGTFKGDRYSTRWEVAMVLARLLAKTEQVESAFASKDDAETLKKLLVEYKEELEAFGVRVDALEKGYAVLDKRVDDLEKIKFYGNLDMLYLGQQVGGQLATAGQLNAFSVNDWTNGRPISNGRAVSAKSILGLVTNFDGIKSGAEFAGYYGYGDPAVDNYWGVTPPYFSNPFTAASGGGGVVSMNNPFSKLSFDNFWFKHEKSKIRAIAGTYNPELMNKHVLLGEPNPNINAPFILPFYGANVSGNFTWVLKNPVYYEIMYSRMPSASNAANPNLNYYQTPLISAAMGYDFKCGKTDGKLSFTVVNVNNDRITNGTVQAVGLINIPTRPDPANRGRSQGWQGFGNAGPQAQGSWGMGFLWNFAKDLKFKGEVGQSKYNADKTNTQFFSAIQGSLYRLGLGWKPKNWDFAIDYISVSPTYDSMLFQYPAAVNIPVFLPFSTYYSNYYQLHDYNNYPDNRVGMRFKAGYDFKKGNIYASYGDLTQKLASTRVNISCVGFVEPFFPELLGTEVVKGSIKDASLGVNYEFANKLKANLGLYRYYITRNAQINPANQMNLHQNVGSLNLVYPLNRFCDFGAGYSLINYRGLYVDQTQQGFTQGIFNLSAS